MPIELSQETQQLLAAVLASGDYASADGALRDGLLLLSQPRLSDEAMRRRLAAGVEQSERGELLDPQIVLDRINEQKRLRSRKPT